MNTRQLNESEVLCGVDTVELLSETESRADLAGVPYVHSTAHERLSDGKYKYDVYRNNVLIGTVDGTSFTDNAIASGLYEYYVKAFDDTNNYSVASETLSIDTEAPLPPVLMIDSSDNEKASMYWTCSDNVSVVKYEIYRDGKKIKTLTEDEFTDSELEYDKQYEYHVAAYDAAGNRSKDSNTVTVFTGEDEEPPVCSEYRYGT